MQSPRLCLGPCVWKQVGIKWQDKSAGLEASSSSNYSAVISSFQIWSYRHQPPGFMHVAGANTSVLGSRPEGWGAPLQGWAQKWGRVFCLDRASWWAPGSLNNVDVPCLVPTEWPIIFYFRGCLLWLWRLWFLIRCLTAPDSSPLSLCPLTVGTFKKALP